MLITSQRQREYHDLDALPAATVPKLAALGITTLDELRDHWAYGNRQPHFDLSPRTVATSRLDRVDAACQARRHACPEQPRESSRGWSRAEARQRARGVLLSAAERKTVASGVEIPSAIRATRGRREAKKTVSLVAKFPKVRDQGQRGTCVAFASVAFLEFHLSPATKTAGTKRRSEQFVYWACKRDDGAPKEEGTYCSTARQVLKKSGACLAQIWKYNPLPIPKNEGQGPPPPGAEEKALLSRFGDADVVAAKNLDRLREMLDDQRPVVISVLTFPSWDYPTVADTGEITMPLPGDGPDGGHAVCLVGYEVDARHPGGGAFIFRNWWAPSWAKTQGRFGAGYGTLYFAYVKKYGIEAFA